MDFLTEKNYEIFCKKLWNLWEFSGRNFKLFGKKLIIFSGLNNGIFEKTLWIFWEGIVVFLGMDFEIFRK